jgi:tetratricopeptide (TPR) repeat protein
MVKRRLLPTLPGQPEEVTLGWVQQPASKGNGFSLGLFLDRRHFSQVALVDGHGRVFLGTNPCADTFDETPVFRFVPDGLLTAQSNSTPPPRRDASSVTADGHQNFGRNLASPDQGSLNAAMSLLPGLSADSGKPLHGAIVGQDDFDRPLWLAAWRSENKRYDLLELRPDLPKELREGLEYRDAMAIAFFSTYLLPHLSGFMIGYGAGNIFRRLRQEAPLGAIRRSVADVVRASARGMRVSGLEEHFSYLMHEVGALDQLQGLEAVHGAEPMHLFTSSYSKSFFLSWTNGLEYRSALKALQIEGSLNRFAAVSAILERNRRRGLLPTEDTVTHIRAARLDLSLIENPALIALPLPRVEYPEQQKPLAKGLEITEYPAYAQREAAAVANTAERQGAQGTRHGNKGSEWVYRQTLSALIRRLRLPFRFDAEFRSNLEAGNVALGFTTAGRAMMPKSLYDESLGDWRELDDDERAAMSADYNLRVGMMLAALAFGADDSVQRVTLQIDSIGLEEAVKEQDSAIAQMLTDALSAFEQARTGHGLGATGAKGDPKDGDVHGNPANAVVPPTQRAATSAPDETPGTEESSESSDSQADANVTDVATGDESGNAGKSGNADESGKSEDAAGLSDADLREHGGLGENDGLDGHGDLNSLNASGNSNDSGSGNTDRTDHNDHEDLDSAFDEVIKGVDLSGIDLSDLTEADGDSEGTMDPELGSADGPDDAFGGLDDEASAEGNDSADGSQSSDDAVNPADPMSVMHKNPTVRRMVTVTFVRKDFLTLLSTLGLVAPRDFYRSFNAEMKLSDTAGLAPIDADSGWRDSAFAPVGAQEEPEFSEKSFSPQVSEVLGAKDSLGLSIQREDLLQRAVAYFNELSRTETLTPVESARRAMKLVDRLDDPELREKAGVAAGALIDEKPMPDIHFEVSKQINAERMRARDELFKGQTAQAVEIAEAAVKRYDAMFDHLDGIPRYFNSYAERVVYNKLFATPGEKTVLIPDNLFYAHMELGDLLAQISGPQASIEHLNKMVAYAPAYPLSHLRLSVQLARIQDWDSARAATLNALRVALDRDDAAFAYYRYAYSAWMRDEFDLAVAGYVMSESIRPGAIPALQGELTELMARVESQCIEVPHNAQEAGELLEEEGVPVWPSTEVTQIVRRAARVSVDEGLFVPARTLALASARLDDSSEMGLDMVQSQFLRSLNA